MSAASTHRNVKAKISVQGFHSSGLIIGLIDSEHALHPRSSAEFKFVFVEIKIVDKIAEHKNTVRRRTH